MRDLNQTGEADTTTGSDDADHLDSPGIADILDTLDSADETLECRHLNVPESVTETGTRMSSDLEVATAESIPRDQLEALLAQMEQLQSRKVFELARRLHPGLTMEDIRNPHDFPALTDPDWHYADGALTGIQSVQQAIRALFEERKPEPSEPTLQDDDNIANRTLALDEHSVTERHHG
jgi:hypothetical protein